MMGLNSGIEWTTHTWNPWIGCTKIAAGCKNCYAERQMKRYGRDFNKVKRTSKQTWNQVKKYKTGDKVFVCSWSDFFHSDADKWRNEAWEVIKSRPDVDWLILTKRLNKVHPDSQIPKNVWLGVSASNQKKADEQIGILLMFNTKVRFVSLEPLLGPIDLSQYGMIMYKGKGRMIEATKLIDWLIIGGESGPGARPMHPNWARNIRDQCILAGVPFFFKQWGEYLHSSQGANTNGPINAGGNSKKGWLWPDGTWSIRVGKKKAERLLDGREWNQYPKGGGA